MARHARVIKEDCSNVLISVDDTGSGLAQSNPVLKELGPHFLGRPARGHLLPTKRLLIVGQEGGTHREGGGPEKVPDFEISNRKLCAYNKATGKVVGEAALPRNATEAQ